MTTDIRKIVSSAVKFFNLCKRANQQYRGVRKYPGESAKFVDVDFERGLGGAIDPRGGVKWGEVVYIELANGERVHGYCDEEALVQGDGKPPVLNVVLPLSGPLAGPVVFLGEDGEGGEADLSDDVRAEIVTLLNAYGSEGAN